MSVRLKPSKSTARLSSQSLEKLLKSQKNLSRPSPRLWLDREDEPHELGDQGLPILKLTHPLLRSLDSCNGLREFNQVQTQLIVSGLFQNSLAASRAIKKLCSGSQTVSHAVYVFDRFDEPDAFLCNTIMRSYVNANDPYAAIEFYYEKMVGKYVVPNHYTFPILVKACAGIGPVREGEKVHSRVVKFGFESDLFVRNSLIHMYSVYGRIGDARVLFDERSELDLVSWNSMIYGYVKNGGLSVARELFDVMPERDVFSWNSMIAGYMENGDIEAARQLFDIMPDKDIVSWNCMIDGYAKALNVPAAFEFFKRMPLRNIVSWNIMLALYVRNKDYNECLRFFDTMIEVGEAKPNGATLMSVLTASANLGRLEKGKWVHSYVESNKVKSDVLLSTALLTMYAKCGDMDMAKNVFDEMHERSIVSWNSMIMGYGMHGNGEKALEIFLEMEKRGPLPNDATFICILSACTHSGMVLEGWWYFDLMQRVYNIEPKVEHYGCVVDLLARAGLVKDSEELMNKMPMEAGPALWGSLLSACRTHSNTKLGEIVAKRLIELEPSDIGPYVMLSNIYASEGKWADVEYARKMIKENGLEKKEGRSTVHIEEVGSESSLENGSLHRRSMVYSMLSEMGAQMKFSGRNFLEVESLNT
ncbi:Pentatricopeptide repeat [Parasponia andersonii]|uniref:Pentatricopeptide repeat n=1 Tax=Parasponia andersonii TaxID=3476 RepID=A0A2P5ABY9_PARAD|nr:Pentatricopeptide repeat [Parasponia andersonii]